MDVIPWYTGLEISYGDIDGLGWWMPMYDLALLCVFVLGPENLWRVVLNRSGTVPYFFVGFKEQLNTPWKSCFC